MITIGGTTLIPRLGLGVGGAPWLLAVVAEMSNPIWPVVTITRAPLPFRQAGGIRGRGPWRRPVSNQPCMARHRSQCCHTSASSLPRHRSAPRRLLYPVLLAQSSILMLQAPHMCTSPNLRHGYSLIHARLLLAARRARLLPPLAVLDAAAATGAKHHLCAAVFQPVVIVLGNAAIGYLAFCAELAQRRAFVWQLGEQAAGSQRALLAALQQHGRLPVVPADYWLLFCLPAATLLACLHLQVHGLRLG